MHLTKRRRTGGAPDQQREDAVSPMQHQRAGGQRAAYPEQIPNRLPLPDQAWTPAAAEQKHQGSGSRRGRLLRHHRPGTRAGYRSSHPDERARALARHGPQRKQPVVARPGHAPLQHPGGADERQRRREQKRHGDDPRVTQRETERPTRSGLNQGGGHPDRGGGPGGARQLGVGQGGALNNGVGKQRVHADPEQHMHRCRCRTHAQFSRTNQTRDQESGDEREPARDRRLDSRPDHAGRGRSTKSPARGHDDCPGPGRPAAGHHRSAPASRPASTGSHITRFW